eukprot:SAG31_NODE_2797_length_5081_cov_11.092935_2_plen_67_part_00
MDLFGGFAPAPSPAAPTAIDLGFGAPTPAPAAGATVKTISTLECAPPGAFDYTDLSYCETLRAYRG